MDSRDLSGPADDLLTTSAASALLGKSTEFVRRALKDGRLEGHEETSGGRKRLFVTRDSAEGLRAELHRGLAEQGLTTADIENALLRRELAELETMRFTQRIVSLELELAESRERERRLRRERDELDDDLRRLRRMLEDVARPSTVRYPDG